MCLIGLISLTTSESVQLRFLKMPEKRVKNLELKIFAEIKKSLYKPMKVSRSFFENPSQSVLGDLKNFDPQYHILDMTLVSVLPLEAGDGPEEHDSYFIKYNTCVSYMDGYEYCDCPDHIYQ